MPKIKAIVGLDIGRHTVKAVRFERHVGKYELVQAELLPLSGTAGDRATIFRGWAEKIGLRKTPCVIGVPGQSIRFQPLVLTTADPRSLGQAVAMEVSKFNELASETSVYGFVPLAEQGGERRLLLSMARPVVLDELLALPKAVAPVFDIIPNAVAMFNAIQIYGPVVAEPCIYADLGAAGTEIAIGRPGGLMFARSFAIGGQMFTDALAKAANLGVNQAESLKVTQGTVSEWNPNGQALAQVADLWLTELRACLSVYRSAYNRDDDQPRRIILGGGAAALKGLVKYLAEKSGLEVQDAQPPETAVAMEHGARFVTAAGLALTGLGLGATHLSLLPRSIRDELQLRQNKRYWLGSGIVAACILGVSWIGGYRDIQRKRADLQVQRDSLAKCTALAQKIEGIKLANRYILSMLEPVGGLLWNGWMYQELLPKIASAKHARDMITLISDGESYFVVENAPGHPSAFPAGGRGRGRLREVVEKPADPRPKAAFESVIIEGYTPRSDFSTVKKLIEELRTVPFVQSVDLLRDDRQLAESEDVKKLVARRERRFVIEVRVQAPRGGTG